MKSLGLTTTEVTAGKKVRFIDTEVYSAVSRKKQSLRELSREHLNADIQQGHHSSVVDARAAMAFFKLKENLLKNCVGETKPTSALNPKRRSKAKRVETDKQAPKMNEPSYGTG